MACTFVSHSRLKKIGTHPSHLDKILRTTVQVSKVAEQISIESGSDQATINGLGSVVSALSDARAIAGIMNPIAGVPKMVESLKQFREYVNGTKTKKDITGKEVLVTGSERVLGVFYAAFRLIKEILYNFIFGIIYPINFSAKHFKIGESAKALGEQSTLFTLCRSTASTLSTITEIAIKRIQYKELLEQTCDPSLCEDLKRAYMWSNIRSGFRLIKNGCTMASASLRMGGYNGSKWPTLALGLVSSVIGLTEIGFATATPNPTEFPPRPTANPLK